MKRSLMVLALGLPLAYAQVVPALPVPSSPTLIPVTGQIERLDAVPSTPSTSGQGTQLTAALQAPRSVTGELTIGLILNNASSETLTLTASRDSGQNCALAPLLRVLKVGSREVVYPIESSPRICTQDALNTSLNPQQSTSFERKLSLTTGEYMVEGWFSGAVNGQSQKIAAAPIRLSIH